MTYSEQQRDVPNVLTSWRLMIFGSCQIKSKSTLMLHDADLIYFKKLLSRQHFYRNMTKLCELHFHMFFKWLPRSTEQTIYTATISIERFRRHRMKIQIQVMWNTCVLRHAKISGKSPSPLSPRTLCWVGFVF